MSDSELLESVTQIVLQAGKVILEVYATDFSVRGKGDASPVTPDIPVVAEESASAGRAPDIGRPGGRFWLVDPLDGTKEFISRNGEFTVNIALIEDGEPVLGVVLAPALGRLFAGSRSTGAYVQDHAGRRPIRCRPVPEAGLTVVASRSHGDAVALDEFLAGRAVAHRIAAGSSLKLCLVATGEADLYPRLGRTMEWDIAAGHAVLAAAGGSVRRLDDGQPMKYGKPAFDNPHFVAAG